MRLDRAPVVVGVDDPTATNTAITWAVGEARSCKAPLRLVYGYGWSVTYPAMGIYGTLPVPDLSRAEAVGESLLQEAASNVRSLAPDLPVTAHVFADDPVRVLLQESRVAATLVLGSRGLGAFGSAVLGSVGAAVAARAACPVVVVRGPAGMSPEGASVVVGVDLRDPEPALRFGFDFASRRGVPLHAVACWRPDLLAEMMWRPEPPGPSYAEAWLAEALAGWVEKYPDVRAHAALVRDHPVHGLLAASAAQYLLVVGSRGRHAMAGTLLGSVSQGVLHHATCPVAVVPMHEDRRG